MQETSEFIRHEACPHCGSSDANALYSDGKHYCFSCQTLTPAEEEEVSMEQTIKSNTSFLEVEPNTLV